MNEYTYIVLKDGNNLVEISDTIPYVVTYV